MSHDEKLSILLLPAANNANANGCKQSRPVLPQVQNKLTIFTHVLLKVIYFLNYLVKDILLCFKIIYLPFVAPLVICLFYIYTKLTFCVIGVLSEWKKLA